MSLRPLLALVENQLVSKVTSETLEPYTGLGGSHFCGPLRAQCCGSSGSVGGICRTPCTKSAASSEKGAFGQLFLGSDVAFFASTFRRRWAIVGAARS